MKSMKIVKIMIIIIIILFGTVEVAPVYASIEDTPPSLRHSQQIEQQKQQKDSGGSTNPTSGDNSRK